MNDSYQILIFENDIARVGGEGYIYFMVRTTTRGQSVYPDIAPSISIYCCQVEMRRCLVVQRHLCFQRKRGDNSTTNRALKIYRSCIEYTRLPRDHFRPMIFLEVC